MRGPEPNLSRRRSKRGRERANNILNLLIVVVVMLIIFTAAKIFMGNNNNGQANNNDSGIVKNKDPKEINGSVNEDDNEDDVGTETDSTDSEGSTDNEEDSDTSSNGNSTGQDEESNDESDGEASNGSETVIKTPSTEPHILETIINPAWKPIGTTQTGAHISSYDNQSVDWNEKVDAITYASGLTKDNMTIWIIKNGGSAQKSIAVVSSLDKTKMYQVYLEWIEGQGWKPVKMDILTTLNFNYKSS